MKFNLTSRFLILCTLLLCAAPALADYMIIWTAQSFELNTGSNIPLCVGDMIGNGSNVIVGRFATTTEIRDAMTGAVLKQFEPYELFGNAYAMVDLDNDGTMECVVSSENATSVIDWVIVAAADEGDFSARSDVDFSLHPNPSKPGTTAAFTMAEEGLVEVAIYDVAGRRVRQLLKNTKAQGRQEIRWDGRDDGGVRMASGTYLFELRVNGRHAASRKSVLLR